MKLHVRRVRTSDEAFACRLGKPEPCTSWRDVPYGDQPVLCVHMHLYGALARPALDGLPLLFGRAVGSLVLIAAESVSQLPGFCRLRALANHAGARTGTSAAAVGLCIIAICQVTGTSWGFDGRRDDGRRDA